MTLPYRYRLTFAVVIDGDGLHADGLGAMATRNRLRDRLADDDRVLEVRAAVAPVYAGARPTTTPGDPR